MKKTWSFCWFVFCLIAANAQNPVIRPALLHGSWPANWISCPRVSQRAYGVYYFRKTFGMTAVPDRFIVHLSADNRYRLFVNGKAVCSGPARGDLAHWNFETIDIAPFLKNGENAVAALVWNMGEYAAVGQISNQTAFLLQCDSASGEIINTNTSWKVMKDSAYSPCSTNVGTALKTYYVAGPGDEVNAVNYPWGWEQTGYPDKDWTNATTIAHPVTTGYGTDNQWTLVPRTIPLMKETMQQIPLVRRSTSDSGNNAFVRGNHHATIPARASAVILLDQTLIPSLTLNSWSVKERVAP